jgi:PAS domain S-box-containing protein
MSAPPSDWLAATINAVREVMLKRLEQRSLDPEAGKDVEMAIEELDVMWEELQGQAELLSREHERYAEFFEFAPDAYLITDAGGNLREANRAALELLGASAGEVAGRPLSQFIAERERVAFLSKFVGTVVNPEQKAPSWRSIVQPAQGGPREVAISVRGMPLKRSGVRGLCWLLRPVDGPP